MCKDRISPLGFNEMKLFFSLAKKPLDLFGKVVQNHSYCPEKIITTIKINNI